MPKDWLRYKAEIQRYYIVEEKTVYQVREILKGKHSFSASVRAYRMKFDEWGMRKYKSQKSRSNTASSTHTQPSASEGPEVAHSTSPHPNAKAMAPINGESSAMDLGEPSPTRISDVLARITDTTSALDILEAILFHWQPDPEFTSTLVAYFQEPEFNKWVSANGHTPAVFRLIENCVEGREYQFILIKLLLEADLLSRPNIDDPSTPWQESWYQACNSSDFDQAKEMLQEDSILSLGPKIFLDCAEVVIAERFLQRYEDLLTCSWTNRTEDGFQVSALPKERKSEYTRKYREILRSFHHAKDDVSPRFYRFLLRFDLADESEGAGNLRIYEDEYRQKYILLSSLRPPRVGGLAHDKDVDDENGVDLGWFFGVSNRPTTANNLPPTPPTPASDSIPRPFTTTTTAQALEILIQKWHSLSGFEKEMHSLLSRDGSGISIFATPSPSSVDDSNSSTEVENIFDAITTTIPDNPSRISLTKAILVTSSVFPSTPTSTIIPSISPLLSTWQTIYPSTPTTSPCLTFQQFRTQLIDNQPLASLLSQVVKSEEGRKLVMDAMVSLVGERLLAHLKGRLGVRDELKKMRVQSGYLAVMKVLGERGLVVDNSWLGYTVG